jgi:transposase-like protein
MSVLSEPQYHSEEAAYTFVEAHVWRDGRVCPHCGVVGRSGALTGKSTRIGVYKCYACRKPFTVKVGTIFESSHVKLHIWLQAMFLLCSSKKGMSTHQLHRTFGVTLKTAWFMTHRIREAMREGKLSGGMGGEGKFVEADEPMLAAKRRTGLMRRSCPAMNLSSRLSSAKIASHPFMSRTSMPVI